MPTYHIEMMEGRAMGHKNREAGITRVSVRILGSSPESADILIARMRPENWPASGTLWAKRS